MLILLKSFFPNILFAGERKKPDSSDAASDQSYDLVDSELESAAVCIAECERVEESAACERVEESAACERVEESAVCESKCEEAEDSSAEDILKKKNNVVDYQRDDHDRALLMVKTLSRLQLVEMCKRHNLMRTGGKFQLAHRIVLFNKNV